jgi:hypothetical protein
VCGFRRCTPPPPFPPRHPHRWRPCSMPSPCGSRSRPSARHRCRTCSGTYTWTPSGKDSRGWSWEGGLGTAETGSGTGVVISRYNSSVRRRGTRPTHK